MAIGAEQSVTFAAKQLCLEGRLRLPERPTAGIVVCHPHPQYGGTMDFPVVTAVADGMAKIGWATLRFNFRGVGSSEGSSSGGLEEVDDASGAVDFLRRESGLERVVLAGYSFGAVVALRAGVANDGVDRLVAVATPVAMFDIGFLRGSAKPKLFVQGDADPFGPIGEMEQAVAALETARLVRLDGADHFLQGFEAEVTRSVRAFLG